jgi:hypothetical protein
MATFFILSRYRRALQELQLPHKTPHHEKNAVPDPDGDQHSENFTNHPGFLGFAPGPPPFSAMNSTPAAFQLCRMACQDPAHCRDGDDQVPEPEPSASFPVACATLSMP